MNNLTMNFSNEQSNSQLFSLKCINNSSINWIFFLYQAFPQMTNVFPLAWLVSPYKISKGSSITFQWTQDYDFVWSNSAHLTPGVIYDAGGTKPCDIQSMNQIAFNMDDNAPQLTDPFPGGPANTLSIHHAGNIPNGVFSTGIGMSGQAICLAPAQMNTNRIFSPQLKIFLAASCDMLTGQVLLETITDSVAVEFPDNVNKLTATLNPDNTWTIN